MSKKNLKSDAGAKAAYVRVLEKDGYENIQIKSSPSDIIATKNGETFYFEIKMTKQTEVYFGAATLTEWHQAIKTPNNYKFVIAITDSLEENFEFKVYSPDDFMEHSTIPPFKINFNISLKILSSFILS
jgi:Holliday junction resolvase